MNWGNLSNLFLKLEYEITTKKSNELSYFIRFLLKLKDYKNKIMFTAVTKEKKILYYTFTYFCCFFSFKNSSSQAKIKNVFFNFYF